MQRAADKIGRLCREPHDLVSLWQETTEVLATAVPHYWTPCWYTLDPASLLMTSHFHLGLAEFPPQWLAAEYGEERNGIVDVARSATGLSTLHESSGGDPSKSERWQRNMTMGGDQEMIARLRTRSGEVWGALALYREPGAAMFDPIEKEFVATVAPTLADGVRRALLIGQAAEPRIRGLARAAGTQLGVGGRIGQHRSAALAVGPTRRRLGPGEAAECRGHTRRPRVPARGG